MAKESFKEEIARMSREREDARSALRTAFERSPAIVAREIQYEELWILSPETVKEEGQWRVTFLRHDGPRGHFSGKDMEDLIKELSSTRMTYTPVDESFVMQWTSTPEYEEGVKQVALVQADNQLRWIARQHSKEAYAWAMTVREQALEAKDLETATKLLERAAADVQAGRVPNPRALKRRLLRAFR